ncbi:MAG: nucleoside hydrolase [Halanaerobiales bacterium]|nr:nucleoside hydrolase [Bacillota bacterium]HOA40652.1 nucleoside hydrolase [Halanaerobiales bacterium]HPZ63117.1 nucleoside hydrolase [Halanaerobiales bacterium]HQD04646.1 nucleoside hydrolase [Halanaerobiales bacterium]
MKKIPVIIDCDPGHDDAIALLWALASPSLEVKAVTTVAGNQSIEKVTDNAIKVLTKARVYDIPVGQGYSRPLIGELNDGGLIHGETGLDGPRLPEKAFEKVELNSVELMIKTIEEAQEKITLVALGPLSNLARLFIIRPDLKEKIEQISLMGGGTYGNWIPAAEYNIWVDPEAAKVVFDSGIPIIMAGLDVTQKAYVTDEENEKLKAQGNEVSIFVSELIEFYRQYHYQVEGFPGCTLHDPCAIAALVHPEIFTAEQCHVDIELNGKLTRGMTVIDRIGYLEKIFNEKKERQVKVLFGVDREKFVEYLLEAMARLP